VFILEQFSKILIYSTNYLNKSKLKEVEVVKRTKIIALIAMLAILAAVPVLAGIDYDKVAKNYNVKV